MAIPGLRDRLADFARACIAWGSPDCCCGEQAQMALEDAGVEEGDK